MRSQFLRKGTGVPLVFLHGFLGTSQDWGPVCSYLPGYECIGIDLPGHGTAPFREHFEIDLDIEEFHLIGYSMGGRLALAFADKHPQRIASLILASTHPGLKTEKEKQKRALSDAEWAKLLLHLPIDEFLIRWYSQPLFHSYKPDFNSRRIQNVEALAKTLIHYSLSKQRYYNLEKTLVLVGEWDEKFRALIKRPLLIEKSGHAVHLENPESVAFAIKSFLTKKEETSK